LRFSLFDNDTPTPNANPTSCGCVIMCVRSVMSRYTGGSRTAPTSSDHAIHGSRIIDPSPHRTIHPLTHPHTEPSPYAKRPSR
jgi:hypothetical protein